MEDKTNKKKKQKTYWILFESLLTVFIWASAYPGRFEIANRLAAINLG